MDKFTVRVDRSVRSVKQRGLPRLSVRTPTSRVLNSAPPAKVKRPGNFVVNDVLLKVGWRVPQPGPRRTLRRIGTGSQAADDLQAGMNRPV
jgi:hypothetical protein